MGALLAMITVQYKDKPFVFSGDVLKGKRILVTGGGTGLGKEMAARHGVPVATLGRDLSETIVAVDFDV